MNPSEQSPTSPSVPSSFFDSPHDVVAAFDQHVAWAFFREVVGRIRRNGDAVTPSAVRDGVAAALPVLPEADRRSVQSCLRDLRALTAAFRAHHTLVVCADCSWEALASAAG